VGRVFPRHRHRGRPLNSIVRHQMNRWDPKPLLELREGSLLRSVGLSERAGKVAQVAWALAVIVAASMRPSDWMLSLGGWALGTFAINYVAARLGGRPATYTAEGDELREDDSAFQMRLLIDVTVLVYLVAAFSLAILGRPFLNWVSKWI